MKKLLLFFLFLLMSCAVSVPIDIKVSSSLIPEEAAIDFLNSNTEKNLVTWGVEKNGGRADYSWLPIFKKEGLESYGNKRELVRYSDLSFQVHKVKLRIYSLSIIHKDIKFNLYPIIEGLDQSVGWMYRNDDFSSFEQIDKAANAMIALGMKYIPPKGK